jgi:hypothetical protein
LVRKIITTEEIKNNLLLTSDWDGQIFWHVAVDNGNVGVMQEIWEFAREDLPTEEIKIICY